MGNGSHMGDWGYVGIRAVKKRKRNAIRDMSKARGRGGKRGRRIRQEIKWKNVVYEIAHALPSS